MKWLRVLIVFLLMTAIFLSSCTRNRPETEDVTAQPPPVESPAPQTDDLDASSEAMGAQLPTAAFVPGQALVKFKPQIIPELPTEKQEDIQGLSVDSTSLDPTFSNLGITSIEPLLAPAAGALGVDIQSLNAQADDIGRLYVVEFDPSRDVDAIATGLSDNDQVEYAEPNYVAYATDEPAFGPRFFRPNDRFFSYQWNLQAIQMEQAWDTSTGAGVTVAILDTGVAYETFENFQQAPDLAGARFVPGYDFVNEDSHPNDDQGHGTHVAGTLAQTTNNGEGAAGVAYEATIMPVKILDSRGQGSYAAIVQGINFALVNGADVINLSLSGNSQSQALEEAVTLARNRGVLVVTAAGNNNGPVGYPAAYANTLAVGAIRFDRVRARYSNFGPEIDLVAPGGDNRSDQNQDGYGDGILQQTFKAGEINTFRYLFFEGTSMATPHVSGVIALLLAHRPDLTADQIETILKTTSIDLGLSGRDNEFGYGLIQAAAALAASDGPPPTDTPTPTPTPTSTTPTPTPSPTPVTSTPSPVGNILLNSGFEADEAWIFKPTVRRGGYNTGLARTGSRSALIGILDANADAFSFSSVSQRVTIPADARQVTLKAFIYPVSQDVGSRDLQIISVLNENFREIQRFYNKLSDERSWQEQTFDLTAYNGRTIYIYFGVLNRTANNRPTALYIDDVSLVIAK